jgi:hypothetical protein
MTKSQNMLSLSTLALVGALFALPAISSDANASATSKLMNCQFNSMQKTIDCCEKVLRKEDKPLWMIGSGTNCKSVAKCFGGGTVNSISYVPQRRCRIVILEQDGGNGDRQRGRSQRSGRQSK